MYDPLNEVQEFTQSSWQSSIVSNKTKCLINEHTKVCQAIKFHQGEDGQLKLQHQFYLVKGMKRWIENELIPNQLKDHLAWNSRQCINPINKANVFFYEAIQKF